MRKIKSVTPCSSGGGVYLFTGALSNNEYFLASNSNYDVRIINRNPDDYDYDEEVWMADWQEECLVEDLSDLEERKRFFHNMFRFIRKNKPKGNYSMDSIDWMENYMKDYYD